MTFSITKPSAAKASPTPVLANKPLMAIFAVVADTPSDVMPLPSVKTAIVVVLKFLLTVAAEVPTIPSRVGSKPNVSTHQVSTFIKPVNTLVTPMMESLITAFPIDRASVSQAVFIV
ncbi:hypothetical protein D3C77_357270 [compost metagenome]